jgi:tetratricopeptide (TPR) repeat protein
MRVFWIALCSAAVALASVALHRANEAWEQRDFAKAAALFLQFASGQSQPAQRSFGLYNAALALQRAGNLRRAIQVYEECMAVPGFDVDVSSARESAARRAADLFKNLGLAYLRQATMLASAVEGLGFPKLVALLDDSPCSGDATEPEPIDGLCKASRAQSDLARKAARALKVAFRFAKRKRCLDSVTWSCSQIAQDVAVAYRLARDPVRSLQWLSRAERHTRGMPRAQLVADWLIAKRDWEAARGGSWSGPALGWVVQGANCTKSALVPCQAAEPLLRLAHAVENAPFDTPVVPIPASLALQSVSAAGRKGGMDALWLTVQALMAMERQEVSDTAWSNPGFVTGPLYEVTQKVDVPELVQAAVGAGLWRHPLQRPGWPVPPSFLVPEPIQTHSPHLDAVQVDGPDWLWSQPFPGRTDADSVDWDSVESQLLKHHGAAAARAVRRIEAALETITKALFPEVNGQPSPAACALLDLVQVPHRGCPALEQHEEDDVVLDNLSVVGKGEWKQGLLARGGNWNTAIHTRFRAVLDMVRSAFECSSIQVDSAGSPDHCPSLLPPQGGVEVSKLAPGTVLKPHANPSNLRWRAHIGLRIPDAPVSVSPSIHVAGQAYRWAEGRLVLLDDSFVHYATSEHVSVEAGARVVLILDVWHPALLAESKEAAMARRAVTEALQWKSGDFRVPNMSVVLQQVLGER